MSGDGRTSEPLGVLVIDDDYRVAMVHQGFVERVPGVRVVGRASTAAEARRAIADLRPDIALMDIYLPDGDGLEVLRELPNRPDGPEVIVISAASDLDSIKSALRLGAVHYLVKPFGFEQLAQRLGSIRHAIEQARQWPTEATQSDVDQLLRALRDPGAPPVAHGGLAPTLRVIRDAVVRSDAGLSASEIASAVGVSRATAQRCLAQLEQSGLVELHLQYGATGRPEHRYTARRR